MPARIGGMATFPARFHTLPEVVGAIAPQLDTLYIYINQSDTVPAELASFKNVVPLLGKDHDGDLSATGKVYPLSLAPEDCYYFTLDDDFIYPPDYVGKMVAAIELFGRKAAVTVHGSIFAPEADWYYERSRTFGSVRGLELFHFVTMPGSGTAAFHRGSLKIDYGDFPCPPMVDLQLAICAKEQGVPWLAVPREHGWLKFLGHEGLWQTSVVRMTHHTVAMLNAGPWSFNRFRATYNNFLADLSPDALSEIESGVLRCLMESTERPADWGMTRHAKKSRERHERLMDVLLDRPAAKTPEKPSMRPRREIVRSRLAKIGVPDAAAMRIALLGSRIYWSVKR